MSYSAIDVYNKALGFICELNDPQGNTDYELRAPYLLASFCSTAKSLDKNLRKANGLAEASSFSHIYISLMDTFPLCDELIHPAALYIASMLIIDDDAELSANLYDRYCDAIATVAACNEAIAEKYFYD